MPSSTSSSEGVPLRPIPDLPWGRAAVLALVLLAGGLAGWELYWRGRHFVPSARNTEGLWALARNRVEREGGEGIVIVGASRLLFDMNLETWKEMTGRLPIQLALEGTNPRPVMTHLAEESEFHGLLVVGVTPGLFFTPGFGYREASLEHYKKESPSQWTGQQISMLLDPLFAFYHYDTALFRVLGRQPFWPERSDYQPPPREVRRLSTLRHTRQSDMWEHLERDPEYAALCQSIWLDYLVAPQDPPPPEEARKFLEGVFEEVQRNVETIRLRGGEVVFVRAPSTHRFREVENGAFPRQRFWDELLRRTGAVGVHFEDHPELADLHVPEWSHISSQDTPRFTRLVVESLRSELLSRGTPRPELQP